MCRKCNFFYHNTPYYRQVCAAKGGVNAVLEQNNPRRWVKFTAAVGGGGITLQNCYTLSSRFGQW
ncbi:hypothetical protein C7N43_25310 [Sphingobacteriales bacterium UPWRP_1]|nr:hypothetical protein BVG80_17465 [Sphingobacteriales bacterium TSM_CSM]PSJ74164.1 hypothetical protein C7N43_25310 [Sphingobacteriales bacterium UPWRP_1]